MKNKSNDRILTHEQYIAKAEKALSKLEEGLYSNNSKPLWHFSPKAGWMNDPNGFVFFKGEYHIFYQFNPYDTKWGAMHWGHAISQDLINWQHMPIALAPSEPYDLHPKGGCFSGSAVDNDGVLTLIYTGVACVGGRMKQTQCIATSTDGIHFEKYKKNPVIDSPGEYGSNDFRDPKVWRYNKFWYMVVGSSKDGMGRALLYKSLDLKTWDFVNVLCESKGELGTMWECPDFFEIEGKHVLTFSPMGAGYRKAMYLVGDMDYNTGKFHYQTIGEIDWGFDYYAPQSMIDHFGRRIVIAWANGWDWMNWWSTYSPFADEGWCGSFSFPREIKLCSDGKLQFIPIKEHKTLRGDKKEAEFVISASEKALLPSSGLDCYEMILQINILKSNAKCAEIVLKAEEDKGMVIYCNIEKGEIVLDRNNADSWSKGKIRCPLEIFDKEKIELHIFADRNSIELYTDNYRSVMSSDIYGGDKAFGAYIVAHEGMLDVKSISYCLKPAKIIN
jgi:beta-fructofuranosidase